MLGKIFGVFCLVALIFGVCNGRADALGVAILDGASAAVNLTLSLCGMTCFWCGILEVLRETGAIRRLSQLLRPLLRLIFPNACKTGEGVEEIAANISANLLGIGNAATPMALAAMEQLQKHNPHPDRASPEQITLAVMNTASITLIPANLLALRRAANSAEPYTVLLPVWAVSFSCAVLSVLLTRAFSKK